MDLLTLPCLMISKFLIHSIHGQSQKKPGELTPSGLCDHANNVVLPQYKPNTKISLTTSYCWLHCLGFHARKYSKGLYYDGHERPDVVEYRSRYLNVMAELRSRSAKYAGDNLEQRLPVDPQLLNGQKRTVFCFHDESTVHANERPKYAWLCDNTNELRKKGQGRLIHDSD